MVHADSHECFLLGVFRYVFPRSCFLLRVFRCVFSRECFLFGVFCWGFLDDRFLLRVFRYVFSHRPLIIPIIGDCEQHSLRSTFAAVFV